MDGFIWAKALQTFMLFLPNVGSFLCMGGATINFHAIGVVWKWRYPPVEDFENAIDFAKHSRSYFPLIWDTVAGGGIHVVSW